MTDSVVDGKHISLTYVIKDVSGETLEQSELPVTYIQGGHSELIGGMDDALRGKRAGDWPSDHYPVVADIELP
jgi:FKBP-type peptidyl-prolyl cis-trans isomerase SlyD